MEGPDRDRDEEIMDGLAGEQWSAVAAWQQKVTACKTPSA
jgi:hypothetical protein